MILKQLKQLTLRRNANILRLPRFYSSPAVSQALTTTSKPSKRLSRDDRRLVVESFVTKYRAANAGKFPTLKATVKEVGGCYYIVRSILQELKLRPNAPISRVPASIANDASSLKQDHSIASSHPSSDEVTLQGDKSLVITATHDRSETVTASLDKDVDSKCDGSTHLLESQTFKVSEEWLKKSETEEEGTLTQIQEPRADHLQGANVLTNVTTTASHDKKETKTDSPCKDVDSKCDSDAQLPENQTLKVADGCLKNSETNKDDGTLTQLVSPEPKADHLEVANVLPATHDNREMETAPPNDDADSKCDATTHLPSSQKSKVSEECIKISETEEEGILTHLGSQEPKADCHEGGAASAKVLPTETRQVPVKGDGEVKTEENSSAWSNIISFAKEFANFWRKG
ncbi:hypothetical protein N665_0377s0046 [Sinapis alba]|nr:hypothetical protein N665_0377s0046 [Sinapis alba]